MRRDLGAAASGPMLQPGFQLPNTQWVANADVLLEDSELYDALEAAYIEADQLTKAHAGVLRSSPSPMTQFLRPQYDQTIAAVEHAQAIVTQRIERFRERTR